MRSVAWLVCVASLLVAGCAGTPPAFTPNLPEARTRLAGTIGDVTATVDPAAQGSGAVRTTFGSDDITVLWQHATASALDQSRLFDKSARMLNVRVTITTLKPPATGGTIDTPASARYQLVDARSGSVVYETTVENVGHVDPTEDFLGAVRIRESIDRAAQSNIRMFVDRLAATPSLPQ